MSVLPHFWFGRKLKETFKCIKNRTRYEKDPYAGLLGSFGRAVTSADGLALYKNPED